MNWLQALTAHANANRACVLVTVVESTGSSPRKTGARMVVDTEDFFDTLGGGALELEAISHARALLANGTREPAISHRNFILGSDLTQCCGGTVNLQFDCQWANDFVLHVFGAGHVAQEVARITQRLPCISTFHDSRSEWLEKLRQCISAEPTSPHAGIRTSLLTNNPHACVESCEPGAYFLIMTHSHELDLELVEAVLSRGDARYCGLIASGSKAASFRGRLKRQGFSDSELSRLTAPLGTRVNTGNTPMEVAVAGIADILHERQSQVSQPPDAEGAETTTLTTDAYKRY